MQLEPNKRTCNAGELRILSRHRSDLIKAKRIQGQRVMRTSLGLFGILAILTCLSNPKDALIIILFWVMVGVGISFWIYIPGQRGLSRSIQQYDRAIASGMAEEYSILSTRFWEIEEKEDEGACYAFELLSRQVVFLSGQEYDATRKFPSLDFSWVVIKDNSNQEVEMLIESRGPRVPPEKTFPAKVKSECKIPEHGVVMDGTLEEVFEKIQKT
jgi:hypothetical protein